MLPLTYSGSIDTTNMTVSGHFQEQIKDVLEATSFPSTETFAWFGISVPGLSSPIIQAVGPETARARLVFALQHCLYEWFYSRGAVTDPRVKSSFSQIGKDPLYSARLAKANSGGGYWDQGWKVTRVSGTELVIEKGEFRVWASVDECLLSPEASLKPGSPTSLRRPAGSSAISPGYYTAASDRAFAADEVGDLLRIYWNLTSDGAVRFMKIATSALNRESLPFVVKAASDLTQVSRVDSTVMYLRKDDFSAAGSLIERIHAQVVDDMDAETPALTMKMAYGLGLSEDDGQGKSFGLQRCRLLALGMISAYEKGFHQFDERFAEVERSFAEYGISLEKPYLRPGSNGTYEPLLPKVRDNPFSSSVSKPVGTSAESALDTAARIAHRLCDSAIWHGDLCNWIGPEVNLSHSGRRVMFSGLGPDLYSGTSGLALFLAETYKATGEPVLRRTSLGAIAHALAGADDIPHSSRLSPYTGSLGIALIAAHLGVLQHEEKLVDSARRLVEEVMRGGWADAEFDLISGKAGGIVALSLLRTIVDNNLAVSIAANLGDELLHAAHKSQVGYSWPSTAFPDRKHLTGYSHGTAGVGRALLELFRMTGEQSYGDGAQHAFDYERHWFNGELGNWPDFREEPRSTTDDMADPANIFQAYWCHGAGGIALSRLRGYEITNDQVLLDEARSALSATTKMTKTWLEADVWNYSLCHGLAGNAEILRYGHSLGALADKESTPWIDVAEIGVEKYVKRERIWPCGVDGEEVPGLMAGLSGIGYFYLTLHDTTVPSVLSLREGDFLELDREKESGL